MKSWLNIFFYARLPFRSCGFVNFFWNSIKHNVHKVGCVFNAARLRKCLMLCKNNCSELRAELPKCSLLRVVDIEKTQHCLMLDQFVITV